jgi:hypothetical protein
VDHIPVALHLAQVLTLQVVDRHAVVAVPGGGGVSKCSGQLIIL